MTELTMMLKVNEYMKNAGEPGRLLIRNVWPYIEKSRVFHMRNVMNKLRYEGTVYRGSSIKNALLDTANSSKVMLQRKHFCRAASTLPSVAKNFSSAGVVYEGTSAAQFKLSSESAGRAVHVYTFKPDEAEILAKANTYFSVGGERVSASKNYIGGRPCSIPKSGA
ncbi:hypothetical protein OH492_12485 [Vibrio chagasii]|nr:hypothetical protein [Vibrio chagasii]